MWESLNTLNQIKGIEIGRELKNPKGEIFRITEKRFDRFIADCLNPSLQLQFEGPNGQPIHWDTILTIPGWSVNKLV